jgi:hypothetical protein
MEAMAADMIRKHHPNPDSIKQVLFVTLKKTDQHRGMDMH